MDTNSLNLAGEFYVLSRLLLRKYNATFTLGNTKGVDILLSNPNTGRMFKVEVKTSNTKLENNSEIFGKSFFKWPHMNIKHERCAEDNLIFCFVNFDESEKASLWIIHSRDVQEYIKWEHTFWVNGEHKKEINPNMDIRTFRIYPNETEERDSKNREICKIKSMDYLDNFSIFE